MSHNKKNVLNQHITLFDGVLHQFVHALYSTQPTNVITESVFNKNGLSIGIWFVHSGYIMFELSICKQKFARYSLRFLKKRDVRC